MNRFLLKEHVNKLLVHVNSQNFGVRKLRELGRLILNNTFMRNILARKSTEKCNIEQKLNLELDGQNILILKRAQTVQCSRILKYGINLNFCLL